MEQNQSLNNQENGNETERKQESAPINLSENLTTLKRRRRPSVRLGDIGDQQKQHHDSNLRKDSNFAGTSLNPRALININPISNSGCVGDFRETLDDEEKGNLDGAGVIIGSWKGKDFKSKSKPKRVKMNWGLLNGDEFSRDFDLESSESPVKQQSPINDLDVGFTNDRDGKQGRVSDRRDQQDEVGVSVLFSKGASDWKRSKSGDRNVSNGLEKRRSDNHLDDGVRIWLNELGLGRYAPLFQIHEVDYEVLPLLTFEDLKDMGVNSVGSRRKMYCAIQKLGQGFS